MSDQYLRKATLLLANDTKALDLSQMQFQFQVNQSNFETPNNAVIRVFNLSQETSNKAKSEFSRVILQAGYQDGSFGTIFDGTIKQVRRGRLNPVDTFLEVIGADSDFLYNFTVVNTTLESGATQQDQLNAIVSSIKAASPGANVSYAPSVALGPVLPRGKVMYGMARSHLRKFSKTNNLDWSLQNGTLQLVPQQGYLPGEAVVLTSRTGMIGLPEQTDNGIRITCLLNPKLKTGGLVKVDNRSIIPAQIDIAFSAINNLAAISADGLYKILVAEHNGDTRGNNWYTELTCLSVDQSSPAANSVKPYAG